MRKRTCKNIADTIFWYALYFLPVLCYLLYMIAEPSTGTSVVDFSAFMNGLGLEIVTNNAVYNSLLDLFGSGGVYPMFSSNAILMFMAWFVNIYIVHLCVDFLLFIPRIAHKWLKDCTE